jgi:predicted alpha/beta hydrolase
MWINWHLVMPMITQVIGYFPGKILGWLEDLPAGVAMEWATRFHPSFHRRYHRLPHTRPPAHDAELEARMGALHAEILAVADVRDPFATLSATRRLLDYYMHCDRQFVRIRSRSQNLPKLGHFGFFHDRFRNTLWPDSLRWLQTGQNPWSGGICWPASHSS